MRTKFSFLCSTTVAFAIALAGCGGDDGSGDDTNNSGSTGSDPTGDPTGNPTSSPTGNPTGDPTGDDTTSGNPTTGVGTDETAGVTEDTGPADSTGPGETGATETGVDTEAVDVCAPDGDDDECAMCTKDMCCDELNACVDADPNCACVLDCLSMIPNPQPADAMACADDCGANFAGILMPLLAIQTCQMGCDPCGA